MLRHSLLGPTRAVLAILAAGAAILACDSAITDSTGYPPPPAFTLTLGTSNLSVRSGGSASTYLRVTRTGGLASGITYTAAGAPPGLVVSLVGTSDPDSATLTVTATATLAQASYQVVVHASAPGAEAQQATEVVTVSGTSGGGPAVSFVAAGAHVCAVTSAGAAYCWGFNESGQLGNNETSAVNPTPIAVAGGLAFNTVSVSKVEGVSCGLTGGGAAYCWGENRSGQLGDGTTAQRLAPTPVAGGLTFRSLAVGNAVVCGVAINGTAYCWGFSPNGAFGDGTTGTHLTPSVAAAGMAFASIVAGSDYACALTPAGDAFCWGLGVFGQLGNGLGTSSTAPVPVSGGLTFRSLAAGGLAVCGLTTAGKAYCWGNNSVGTLGNGTSGTEGGITRSLVPVAVGGGLTFQGLAAGYETMCGVTDAGAGYCWGYNAGEVGDGTLDNRSLPVAVTGGLTFQSISPGTAFSCGITSASAVYCWGNNGSGELGDGTTTPRASPAPVRWP